MNQNRIESEENARGLGERLRSILGERLRSIPVDDYFEEGLLPDTIKALNRGDMYQRSINANLGRSYYSKFIRDSEA